MTALEIHEQRRLDICEERIKRGLATFVDVGKALTEIRDARLYREAHGTFDEYCRDRWGFDDSRARQLIAAADTVTNVTVDGLPAPSNEGQARELRRVPEDDRAEVWAEANERTDGKPTAAAIRDVREERYPSSPPVRDEPPLTGEGERRTVPAGSETPRAQDDDLPDEAQSVARPVEDPANPAPSVKPNEAVTEYLNGSQSVQDAKYLHAFAKAIARADDFLRFDADRVGRLCDNDDVVSVQHLLDFTEEFLSRMRKARTGLRVVNGGKS